MASKTAILAVRIVADEKQAVAGMERTGKAADTMGDRLERAAPKARRVVAGLGLIGAAAVKQASDLEQSAGAVEAVFGRQAGAVKKLSDEAANRLGLARSEYQQMSAVFAAQLQNMGIAETELVGKTDELIGLGGDLAATFGGPTSDAVEALGSLLRGERDPIERFGVSIKQADINARLAADGHDKLEGAAKKTAETEATLALLYEQTSKAQGQRARESNTLASQSERAIANLKNAGADLGTVLLPIVATAVGGLADLAMWASENEMLFLILGGAVGTVAGGIWLAHAAIKAWTVAVNVAKAAQVVWNFVMKANPIGLIITAVAALAAGLVIAYNESETFRNFVNNLGKTGQKAFGWVADKVETLVGWIKSLIEWIGNISWPSPPGWMSDLGGLVGLGGPGPTLGPAGGLGPAYIAADGRGGPGGTGLMMALGRGGGPSYSVNINVDGFVGDEDLLARKIREALDGANRRRGGGL